MKRGWRNRRQHRERGRLTIYRLHLATSIFIASSGTIWRLLSRNTGPTVRPRNRINTTPCPVISLINIDRLINVESTRGTRRRCIHRQPIRSPTRIYLNVRRQHSLPSSLHDQSFHSCTFSSYSHYFLFSQFSPSLILF